MMMVLMSDIGDGSKKTEQETGGVVSGLIEGDER